MTNFAQASQVQNPTGLWLIHGDEPLVASWLMDGWRTHWTTQQVERKRVDMKSAKSWVEALNEFNNIGLFSSQTVVEMHGNHKPDKKTLEHLRDFCENPNDNCLIVLMPTQDWKAQKTIFFKQCSQLGNVVNTTLNNESERQQLLSIKATEFGIQLDNDAWRMLLEQTQNNLLAAYQALWRVSDLAVIQQTSLTDTLQTDSLLVTAEMLKPALVAQSRYSQYDLSDAILAGNVTKVVEVLHYLEESGEAPTLLLWNLSKDARILMQMLHGTSAQDAGVWRNKVGQYNQALRHLNFHASQHWPALMLDIDRSIKGLSDTPVWESLTQLALSMAGKDVFMVAS